jgi:hypothetical protein
MQNDLALASLLEGAVAVRRLAAVEVALASQQVHKHR